MNCLKKHPKYQTWCNIIQRCYNRKNKKYKHYGGRGIFVCDKWRKSSKEFLNWCDTQDIKNGDQIDRIDNEKGYFPGNCKFVSPLINNCNRRMNRNNTSGYVGVYPYKTNQFRSQIGINNKRYHLGIFNNPKDAALARDIEIIKRKLPLKLQVYKNHGDIC